MGSHIYGKSKKDGGFTVTDATPAFETTAAALGIQYQRFENDDVSILLLIKIDASSGTKLYYAYDTWANRATASYVGING